MKQIYACLSRCVSAPDCQNGEPTGASINGETDMPILRLEMHPGRTLEQKSAFAREATRVAVETLNCPPESVDIVITEVAREDWAKAGKLVSEG
jgi:4-oxalocrotonate tautomerase